MLMSVLALVVGGMFKGATGVGTPVVAVPIIALSYDVPVAVAIMLVPNLLTNVYQAWIFRSAWPSRGFVLGYAAMGCLGATAGALALATLPSDGLMLALACCVVLYVGFRLARPDWALAFATAQRLLVPVGLMGGFLQGAVGVSAPVSVTFLHAMRLGREAFIGTISLFFIAMVLGQAPMMLGLGILTPDLALYGLLAIAPIMAGVWMGDQLGRRFTPAMFDKAMLVLLAILACKIFFDVLT